MSHTIRIVAAAKKNCMDVVIHQGRNLLNRSPQNYERFSGAVKYIRSLMKCFKTPEDEPIYIQDERNWTGKGLQGIFVYRLTKTGIISISSAVRRAKKPYLPKSK